MVALRILYLGTPQFAVPALQALIDSRHSVVALVSQPDRPKGRGQHLQPTPTKTVAEAAGVPVLQPTRLKDPALHDLLRGLRPDLGVVAAYGRLLPDAMLEIPRLGMINIHASLLPKYRGAAPVHRAVIAGERETGVTIMRIVSELDAGPVLLSERRPIGGDETTPVVEAALADIGAKLVLDSIDALAVGSGAEQPQDHSRATYAPKIEKREGAIAWDLPASEIHNRVRGLQPWPLVSGTIGGARYLVHRTEVTRERIDAPCGAVLVRSDGLSVVAGDGTVLRILDIQPEGKRVMAARDFLAGHRLPEGARVQQS